MGIRKAWSYWKFRMIALLVKIGSIARFPTHNPRMKEKWIRATGKLDWIPNKHDTICSVHFTPASFLRHARKTYMHTAAVPTLNLHENEITNKEARLLKIKKENNIKRQLQEKQIMEMNRKLTEQIARKEEKPEQVKKAALELDKFKRRLIRAVARLLLTEKKPEEEIWTELKKETGCDCELLWARMRALTLKKLNRLFLANDRMDAVPVPARMSLTDWLMFDLVLVHQNIDLIGQSSTKDNKEKDPPVLKALYELVKMFNIENLSGDNLAEAWSMATLYYNNKGHHCSPMLLQRRWYQLKEATRFKFYNFWYAYRGNTTRVHVAEPYKPTPLQTNIARTFKLLITRPFLEWEDLIKQRLVTLPDEFERKMKARAAMGKPAARKPSSDVPDLVVIEPRIETIDLRLEPDDNATEESSQDEVVPAPPLVRIKQEPQEDMDVEEAPPEPPKKSLFEVVLESTDLENSRIDSMETDEYDLENNDNEIEEVEETVVRDDEITARDEDVVVRDDETAVRSEDTVVRGDDKVVRDEEESHLPQIGSVFGNVSDTSVLGNIDPILVRTNRRSANVNVCNNRSGVVRETINIEDTEENPSGDDKSAGDVDNNINGNKKDSNCVENIAQNNDPVIELSSDDKDDACNIEVRDDVRVPSPEVADDIPDVVNEISDDELDISRNVNSTNVLNQVDETSVVGNVIETSESSSIDNTDVGHSVDATNVTGDVELDTTNVTGTPITTNIIGNVAATNVIASVDKASVTSTIEGASQPVTSEDIAIKDISATQTTDSIVTKLAEEKEVEIIENPIQPVVITDSEDDENIVDDLIVNKIITENVEEIKVVPKTTTDQPMDVNEKEKNLEVSLTEPLKVSADDTGKKIEIEIKPDEKGFKFGELPHDISFVDDGIEFVDDGIAYVDEDSQDETKNKSKEEDENNPKIDPKLLMCPIVYTIRLDDMGLFRTRPFDHVEDKEILDAVTIKSKPIKRETIENVTVNYCGETIESVTVSDVKKTIEYAPESVSKVDDSTLVIKKEPLDVIKKEPLYVPIQTVVPQDHNIVPIESNPVNVNNVTSEDDDSHEDIIDESQKVKPTSYLLQKPRSRRYNPIQLCKNPDFNTRLKRLSVGFFSSPRNRVLIKSCKPLTIDLSKAFESKLISGTLYLKPADNTVTTEVIDDSESHSVSVVPSAMPAQSLIDNSKVADILPMLEQCLEASKQPVEVAPASERNKIINLPDITEIRRINQRLLTAEVTPIQIQNNQPQVPVSIVASPNTRTYFSQKIVTTVEDVQDSRPILTEATDTRGPPKLLEIIDDSPVTTEHTYASTGRYADNRFIAGFRPRQSIITSRPPRMTNFKRMTNLRGAPWKPRQFRPQIPWLSKNNDATFFGTKFDETLLTLDALNKMLFLLTDVKEATEVSSKNSKPKVKSKTTAQQTKSSHRGRPRLSRDDSCNTVDEDEPANSDVQNTKYQKPRINIKSATNYPPDKDKTFNTESEPTQYCCWARQKLYQMLLINRDRMPRHGCTRACKCCCRQLLKDHMLQEQKIKYNELQIIKGAENNADVTLLRGGWRVNLDDDGNPQILVENPTQTAVAVTVQVPRVEPVQQSGAETIVVPEQTPIIDLDATNIGSNTNENELMHVETPNIEANVPSPGGEVFVTTTAVVEPSVSREPEVPTRTRRKYVTVPIIKNNFVSSVTAEAGKQALQYTRCISSDNQSGGIILNAIKTPNTTITPNVTSQSSLTQSLAVNKKGRALNTSKTNISLRSAPTKQVREKMIFLNSKQISDKPTASPVHLGKNKILLTTIKFPPNLRLFHEAKIALEPSFNLPDGVNIILLADGTVSFKIDPNVEVNATDMKEMPSKIAAICAHMHTQAAQEEALKKQSVPPTSAEVVDLVGDDDVSESNLNENTDKVQTTEENVTVNSDGAPSETKVKSSSSNINTNVIDIDSTQNESVENIVIHTQQNIEESTQNEMLSASTEQLQDQPDPSSKVSAELDHQTNLSNQTESSDVQKVTVEDSQDQPDSSSHHVSDDIDLANKSSQIEITDVQKVTVENPQNQPELSSHHVSDDINLANKSSQIESSDVREVLIDQIVHSETSGQDANIEVQAIPEPATQKISTKIPEESKSAPTRPKSKNILSDLMEMSGIFDEDMTPEMEETAQPTEQVAMPQDALQSLIPAPQVVQPPALTTDCQGTTIVRPIVIPTAFKRAKPVPPKIQSAIGELTAITSLYELKYACANKGIFFKLDMDTGYLIPINVCMKGIKPVQTSTVPRKIAPKSVIDLTEDEDKPEHQPVELNTSPSKSKTSLLRDNIASGVDVAESVPLDSSAGPTPKPLAFTGPARPVKLFKALKPSILRRLHLSKINQMSKDSNNTALDHQKKRKQFLRNINLNADTDLDNVEEPISPVLMRPFLKKVKLKRDLMNTYKAKERPDDEPIATTSRTERIKEFATTILSDDSSDDEPLAKIAKKKHENESVTKEIEPDLPVTDSHKDLIEREVPVGQQTESELPEADDENDTMNDNTDQEAPVEKQNELELPANDNASVNESALQANELETFCMSDDDNDFIDQDAPFGFESNEEDEDDEDCCILGV